MNLGELKPEELFSKPKDEPVKPEIEKVDLSAQCLAYFTNPDIKKPWSDFVDEIRGGV